MILTGPAGAAVPGAVVESPEGSCVESAGAAGVSVEAIAGVWEAAGAADAVLVELAAGEVCSGKAVTLGWANGVGVFWS